MITMTGVTLLASNVGKSTVLLAPSMRIHLGGAVSYLNRLVLEPALLALVLPLLKRESEGWYVAYRWSAPDESYSLQVFVWPPGTATRAHDHASWGPTPVPWYHPRGALRAPGRWISRGHARLKKSWDRAWNEGDSASTVLPYDGGIHRISNLGEETPVSVHLYGPWASSKTAGTMTPLAITSATVGKTTDDGSLLNKPRASTGRHPGPSAGTFRRRFARRPFDENVPARSRRGIDGIPQRGETISHYGGSVVPQGDEDAHPGVQEA
jgi:hypothetical protein